MDSSFYINSLDRSISYIRGVWLVSGEWEANSVDTDQKQHSAIHLDFPLRPVCLNT